MIQIRDANKQKNEYSVQSKIFGKFDEIVKIRTLKNVDFSNMIRLNQEEVMISI